jgi:hypothetical protein
MIGYILHGNGTIGGTQPERIAIARRYSTRYLGQPVTVKRGKRECEQGEGVYLYAHTREEIAEKRTDYGEKSHFHPFQLRTEFERGRSETVYISELTPDEPLEPSPPTPES